jgi:adenine deaminase
MNRVVRHAIACGCDPLVALQMATVNTATHFGLERELGSIAPGRRADVILTTDLITLPIHRVIARGVTVADRRPLTVDCPHLDWPEDTRAHRRLGRRSTVRRISTGSRPGGRQYRHREGHRRGREPGADQGARARAAGRENGVVEGEGAVCQIALVERHRGTGGSQNGFVSGFGYKGRWPSPRPSPTTATT